MKIIGKLLKKNSSQLCLTLLALAYSQSALSAALPELADYFQKKLDLAQTSVCNSPQGDPHPDQILQDINLDLISDMSFGIGGVLNLTISPEIDLVLTPSPKTAD